MRLVVPDHTECRSQRGSAPEQASSSAERSERQQEGCGEGARDMSSRDPVIARRSFIQREPSGLERAGTNQQPLCQGGVL